MFKSFFKTAVRSFIRQKGHTIVNIIGLAIGIAFSILIFLFVRFERSYDNYHEKADRIYRVAVSALVGDTQINQTYSSAITFQKLLEEFPEIETGVKFLNLGKVPVRLNDQTFYESRFFAVDAAFFDVFSFPLIQGNPKTALLAPNTMVISKATALKYFGKTEAVGKTLEVDFSDNTGLIPFKITGVSEDVPENSHFHFDLLVSSASFPDYINNTGWTSNNFISYVVLKEGASKQKVEEKFKDFTRKYMGGAEFDDWVAKGNFWEYYLQPLTEIHLHSDLNGEFEANGNKTYVDIFFLISFIILFIACINYMNLSTAKSSLRAREVGMRKVLGSSKGHLALQFLGESIITSFIALILAILIIQSLLPAFQILIGQPLRIQYFNNFSVIPALIGLGFVVGIISGSYPAFVLSSFKPIYVLKGQTGNGKKGLGVRNTLIVFQFAISIFLIIGTITVYRQMRHIQNIKLGFDKEQVFVVHNPGILIENVNTFKDVLRAYPNVEQVSGSSSLPGRGFSNIGFGAEGVEESFSLNIYVCDYDFLNTLKLELLQGRFFSPEFPSDSAAAILNEKAVKLLGWEDPIGKQINNWSDDRGNFRIVGVIKNYHYESLHQEVRPMALFLSGGYYKNNENFISARIRTETNMETIKDMEASWEQFAPNMPFEYSFLDQDYDNLYLNEKRTKALFTIFSLLAIFIACLGLFGLASFLADQKSREIGIRKILGASVTGIIRQLSLHFAKWVLIANLIAWPLGWYFMNNWLQSFVYRVEMGPWIFLIAGVLALIIALLTVGFQVGKAARTKPVDALRYE